MVKTKKDKRSDCVLGINVLYVVLIVLAVTVVFFMDQLHFHFKTVDPRLWLGIETIELTPDVKKQYDIQSTNGLLVSRTFVGSPAQIAGIKDGDVIRRWNGTSVISQEQLQYLIQTSKLGERITITVDRQGSPVLIYCQTALRPSGI